MDKFWWSVQIFRSAENIPRQTFFSAETEKFFLLKIDWDSNGASIIVKFNYNCLVQILVSPLFRYIHSRSWIFVRLYKYYSIFTPAESLAEKMKLHSLRISLNWSIKMQIPARARLWFVHYEVFIASPITRCSVKCSTCSCSFSFLLTMNR